MRKYLTNGSKRISKVSADVQKVYLSKTVIQERKSKSTCNMKYVRCIKKTRKYDMDNWLYSYKLS